MCRPQTGGLEGAGAADELSPLTAARFNEDALPALFDDTRAEGPSAFSECFSSFPALFASLDNGSLSSSGFISSIDLFFSSMVAPAILLLL